MLDKKYGMNYSMPHSVVHIVDNSAFTGNLPVTVVDDPSLLSTIVVCGSPMGEDRHVVPINRSDVTDIAYGMRNLTTADIEKYGQTITYLSSLLAQDVPVKFLRVTPNDATYAFSCMIIQWRWDGSTMHVRFSTTSGNGNNGLPLGVIHSNFKNVEKLNNTLVSANKATITDDDGTQWNQRVFMTNIAAGRGSEYNKFRYAIDYMTQSRRPANTKYLFSTIDTQTDQINEAFEASLINQNNGNRSDAINSVNVAVSKRVPGSSILVPTINESAIKELYADYVSHLKEMIDAKIDPVGGTVEWAEDVYKTLNINIFDPIFGLYIYEGDSDVSLPYFQTDMHKSDIPMLKDTNRPTVYLDDDQSIDDYLANPSVLNAKLNDITYGINAYNSDTKMNMYHVGDVFASGTATSAGLNMITSINQYTGTVTTIPINKVHTFTAEAIEEPEDVLRSFIDVNGEATDGSTGNVALAVAENIARRRIVPRGTVDSATGKIKYADDYIAVQQLGKSNTATGLNTFVIAKVSYKDKDTTSVKDPEVNDVKIRKTKADLYPLFVYPSTSVVSFASAPTDEYFSTAGSTVIVTSDTSSAAQGPKYPEGVSVGDVYVNGYFKDSVTGEIADIYTVVSDSPFMSGTAPTSIAGTKDLLNESYDIIVYQDSQSSTGTKVTWTVTSGTPVDGTNYLVDDIVKFDGISTAFAVGTSNAGVPSSLKVYDKTVGQNSAVSIGEHNQTAVYRVHSGCPYTDIHTMETIPSYEDNKFLIKNAAGEFSVYHFEPTEGSSATQPEDWTSAEGKYYSQISDFDSSAYKYYNSATGEFVSYEAGLIWSSANTYLETPSGTGVPAGLKISVTEDNIVVSVPEGTTPAVIQRYVVAGTQGTLYRYAQNPMFIPANYYSENYGINPNSENGGIAIEAGYTGFFDDNISDIEFKWRYSELLVRAYKGQIDQRIMSPTRCPAKFLFDGATNTIVGQTILPYMKYKPIDIINASTIFTDDEKEACVLDSSILKNITEYADIDVKQAMYDMMVYRCYYGMPEDKRPIGPGFGLSLHLDSGVTDANTALLVNQSFAKRFDNPNASWDIGGYVSTADGIAYTYTQRLVSNLFRHIKNTSINKPFAGAVTNIGYNEYSSFFPDVDTTDWEYRDLLYKSGGNAWIMDVNGNLQRKSQRSLFRENATSDLIQENNMRTLSQLCYLLQNKIDNSALLAYNDDGVLKTIKDECDNMFSNWIGDIVTDLDIQFKRDIDPNDGGEIVVCYVKVTFRGLILRVPIIVNVQRRTLNT